MLFLLHAQNLLGYVEKMTSDAWFCMVGTVCRPYASGKDTKGCDKSSISDDMAIRSGWCYQTQLPSTTWFPSVRAMPVSTRASGPLPASRTAPARGSPLASWPTPASGSQWVLCLCGSNLSILCCCSQKFLSRGSWIHKLPQPLTSGPEQPPAPELQLLPDHVLQKPALPELQHPGSPVP